MTNVLTFTVEDEKVKYLSQSDPGLKKLIHIIGNLSVQLNRNYFESLIKKIIGQQLSVKAANTICNRVEAITLGFNPMIIRSLSDEELRATGVSGAKIVYMRDLTEKVLSGELDLQRLETLSDEEVISTLTKIKGIGKWTAEMFLIFSLGRLNVLSVGDAGLQRAFRWLSHNSEETLAQRYDLWKPYNTIASLYLWEAINKGYVDQYRKLEDVPVN